jgi:hypothetical protein
MKKRERKLQLHRETVRQLDTRPLQDLARVRGGDEWTGCMSDCTECGTRGGIFQDAVVG